eukprot:356266-Chlamydomonas_euryale.AAC.2
MYCGRKEWGEKWVAGRNVLWQERQDSRRTPSHLHTPPHAHTHTHAHKHTPGSVSHHDREMKVGNGMIEGKRRERERIRDNEGGILSFLGADMASSTCW